MSDNHRDDLADAVRHTPKPPRTIPTIDRIRMVVETGQCTRINGLLVDAMTASLIVKAFDSLSDNNKAKLAAMPVRKMASVCWKMVPR